MGVHRSKFFCFILDWFLTADQSNRLLEFTLRLGSANQQCYGTSPNDIARDLKSILLLTSCSNGVDWTIVDGFRISDLLAPDYGWDDDFNDHHSSMTNYFILVHWVESFFKRKQKMMNVLLNGDKWHMVVIIKMFGLLMILPFERFHRWKNLHVQSKAEMLFEDRILFEI